MIHELRPATHASPLRVCLSYNHKEQSRYVFRHDTVYTSSSVYVGVVVGGRASWRTCWQLYFGLTQVQHVPQHCSAYSIVTLLNSISCNKIVGMHAVFVCQSYLLHNILFFVCTAICCCLFLSLRFVFIVYSTVCCHLAY